MQRQKEKQHSTTYLLHSNIMFEITVTINKNFHHAQKEYDFLSRNITLKNKTRLAWLKFITHQLPVLKILIST